MHWSVHRAGVGIYKRKQENMFSTKKAIKKKRKKERKHTLDQESGQEKNDRFLGRERVFFLFFLHSFYKFSPQVLEK